MASRVLCSVGAVLLAVAACEKSPDRAEPEPEPPQPRAAKAQQGKQPGYAPGVSQRILAELRRSKPKLVFESVVCPPDVKPAAGTKMACVVKHGGNNADRHIEVSFSDDDGGFVWARKFPGHSFDKTVFAFLRPRTPVEVTQVSCPADIVSYPNSKVRCTMAAGGERVPIAVTWLTKLGAFRVNRIVDMQALKSHSRTVLEQRGYSVRSMECPRFVILDRPSSFTCLVHLARGELVVPMRVDGGKASMALPEKVLKPKP